jgi:FlaG/FlaF family flagellin (archaellin)
MFATSLHLDLRSSRLAAALAVLATGALTGCQAIVNSTPQAQVRIIHATPDTSGLDIYQGPNALAFNLGFGTVTSYVPLTPGVYTINADTAGSKQVLSSAKANFAASTQYTVLLGNSAASLQQLTLTDQSQPTPGGQIALRLINQATRLGAIDIYLVPAGQKLTAVQPLVTGVIFGTNTGYINVPAGIYSLIMLPTGTVPISAAAAIYTGPQVTYSSGAARTVILIDQPLVTTPGLHVITADDFDPPGT